jgi:hypothetical protein
MLVPSIFMINRIADKASPLSAERRPYEPLWFAVNLACQEVLAVFFPEPLWLHAFSRTANISEFRARTEGAGERILQQWRWTDVTGSKRSLESRWIRGSGVHTL